MAQPIKRVKNMDQATWNKIVAWGRLRGLDIGPTLQLLIELQLERERLDQVAPPSKGRVQTETDGSGGDAPNNTTNRTD